MREILPPLRSLRMTRMGYMQIPAYFLRISLVYSILALTNRPFRGRWVEESYWITRLRHVCLWPSERTFTNVIFYIWISQIHASEETQSKRLRCDFISLFLIKRYGWYISRTWANWLLILMQGNARAQMWDKRVHSYPRLFYIHMQTLSATPSRDSCRQKKNAIFNDENLL